ncbi:MAG: hypothetical protein ABJB05_05265 [Parafilimonas sp.]
MKRMIVKLAQQHIAIIIHQNNKANKIIRGEEVNSKSVTIKNDEE